VSDYIEHAREGMEERALSAYRISGHCTLHRITKSESTNRTTGSVRTGPQSECFG
jgi:hypothetical protein